MTEAIDQRETFINPLLNIQYDLAQDAIYFESPPTLKDIVLRKIVLSLWKNKERKIALHFFHLEEIEKKIRRIYKNNYRKWWTDEVKKIEAKILLLPLLESLQEIFQAVVKTFEKEVLKYLHSLYRMYLNMNYYYINIYLRNLHWTLYGTINYLKSTSLLVHDLNINMQEKSKIVCHCFLQDKIDVLNINFWQINWWKNIESSRRNDLIFFWIVFFNERINLNILTKPIKIETLCTLHLLEWAILNEHEIALQFLWEHSETASNGIWELIKFACESNSSANIICFFISKLNSIEQCDNICVKYGYIVLGKILENQRWHNYFIPATECVLKYIDKMEFSKAVKTIAICWKGYAQHGIEYRTILNNFIKKFEAEIIINLLTSHDENCSHLFSIEDVKFVQNICSFLTEDERKSLFFKSVIGSQKRLEWESKERHDLINILPKQFTFPY